MNVTTTHDPRGGGRPRLIFAVGDHAAADSTQLEFDLLAGVTVVGCAPDADLRLTGVEEHHAEVRRDDADEYIYVHLGARGASRVNGRPVNEHTLRTGDRIEVGTWTLSFYREEYADHGRPHGGRQGGEGAVQRRQQEPRPRGTSGEGGSDRHAEDPGQYF
jgi:pSer/pThr/pTyr-binding forkhead associated (FHA) protein